MCLYVFSYMIVYKYLNINLLCIHSFLLEEFSPLSRDCFKHFHTAIKLPIELFKICILFLYLFFIFLSHAQQKLFYFNLFEIVLTVTQSYKVTI